jgi:tetratricopeptide (TPR) repeat protein
MRLRALCRVALLWGLTAAPALADQNDARLEGLFERLHQAGDSETAQGLERQIWAIWLEIGDPESEGLLQRGVAAMAIDDLSRAAAAFDALVARSPGFAEGWNKRATLRWLVGDYAGSVHDIQSTLALEPRHFGALSGLGLIYTEIGEPEAAIRSFEAALALHPFLPGARESVDRLRRMLGQEPL